MVPDMVADMKVDTGHGGRHEGGQGGRLLFLALGGVGLSQFAASKIRFPNVSQMLSSNRQNFKKCSKYTKLYISFLNTVKIDEIWNEVTPSLTV